MKKILFTLSLIFLFIFTSFSQTQECGTVASQAQIDYLTQTRNDRENWNSPEMIINLPVQHHIVRETNGTGGLDSNNIPIIMGIMNTYFANASVSFFDCGAINYIDNSNYYNFSMANESAVCGPNDVANVINIYYFNSVTSGNSSYCGYAYYPGGPDRVIMRNSCALNGSTLTHELGHYLSLRHTHNGATGANPELVNGSNCLTAGDELCDTPADPTLSTSTVNTSCIYTGTSTDPNGQLYTPDPTNIMSYSRKSCRTFLSQGQYNRSNYSAINDRGYLNCNTGTGTYGCTDTTAINYNSTATINDGSCLYPPTIFCDDFESYSNGSYLAQSSSNWMTWTQPYTASEDIQVTNALSNSGTNSIFFNGTSSSGGPSDVVLPFSSSTPYTNGFFSFRSNFYVMNGAYFNFQAEATAGITWALDVGMNNGTINFGTYPGFWTAVYLSSTYPTNQWFELKIEIDLNSNSWEVFIDGVSQGSFANPTNQIASLDLYPLSGHQFYVDDICYEYSPTPISTYGCTDSLAINYNASANIDDGSCIYCTNDTSYTYITSCDSYSWNSTTYTTSGAYTYATTNAAGCDSTATLNLTINNNTATSASVTACDSYTWLANSMTYQTPGTYINTSINSSGCTLTETLVLTINGSTTSSATVSACDSLSWNGTTYTTSGVYTYSTINANNCDSTATLNLTIGGVFGCTDSTALNYDSLATCDDGLCVYCVYGCMDTTQLNYNPLATCDDGSCIPIIYGCTDSTAINYYSVANTNNGTCVYCTYGCIDPTATNYNPLATCDYGSCIYAPSCNSPVPTGLSVTDLTHDRAKINWLDANTSVCLVEMYRVQYKEQGTTQWSTKTALGSGLCNFGLTTTSKMLWNLTPSTIYEYRVKAWYCLSSASTWSSISTFTTADVCPNVLNFGVSTPTNTRATFTWTAPSAPYSFVRIKLRVDSVGSAWFTAGGFGVMYPALTRNKNGLTAGQSYRASSRTWCNPSGGPHKALSWTPFIYWTQPGTLIRIDSENSTIGNLTVYPNPSRDVFNISFVSEEKQNLKVRLVNVIGEQLIAEDLKQFVGEYAKEIDLTNKAKGIYFLEIETENGVINKKLILQ